MKHTIAGFDLYVSRRKRLELRLKQIRSAMFGESLRVQDVVAKSEGTDLGERLRNTAKRLVRYVDELQGAFYLYGRCDDAVNTCLNMDPDEAAAELVPQHRLSEEWKAIVGNDADYEALDEVVSHELRDLPTTLSQDEYDLLHAFFYCALAASVCPAFVSGEAVLDGMFGGIRMGTVAFLRSILGESVRIGQRSGMRFARADASGILLSDYLVLDGRATDEVAMTRQELVLRELSANELSKGRVTNEGLADFYEYRFWENAGLYDLFSYMDAMYAAYVGKNPCTLDNVDVVDEAVGLPQVLSFVDDCTQVDALANDIYQRAFLRPLTSVEEAQWSRMDDSQRYAAVLEGLDGCDEAVLRDVVDKDGFDMMMDEAYVSAPEFGQTHWGFSLSSEQWKALSHSDRVAMLRIYLEALKAEAEEVEASPEDYVNDADKALSGARDVFLRDVRAWLEKTGLADELFGQYGRLRELYFDVAMPSGADQSYFMDSSYQLFANGTRELVLEALEVLLGEVGLSRTMDDELYFRTFNELDDIKYFIDTTLLRRLRSS